MIFRLKYDDTRVCMLYIRNKTFIRINQRGLTGVPKQKGISESGTIGNRSGDNFFLRRKLDNVCCPLEPVES